jgi:type IV pilus assembly protein PilM
MAENQTTVALNIGSQRVSMAVFETAKNGGLILKALDSVSILADPATDAVRMPQIRMAIIELAQKLKIGKTKVYYAISGQSVFSRFMKLPPVNSDNIRQLVTFEAQQQLPFPIDTVVWDYAMLDGAAGEKEAALVAIKADALDEINSSVTSAGLTTAGIDVSPMAIYNAYINSYGFSTEPILLIDVGAKASDLIYIEGKRFFNRSINVGGAALTTAIAKEYNISFSEAENQKLVNGVITIGDGAQLDPSVAAMGNVIKNAFGRLPTEIARTTNYHRSQHAGNAPRRIILAGGGANLSYAKEFLEEKLGLPVEYFNPLRNVALGKNISPEIAQKEGHMLGELVGLGLRGNGKSTINIDLVPASVNAERASEKRRPFLIGAAAVLTAGVAAFGLLKHQAAGAAEKKLSEVQATQEQLNITAVPISSLLEKESAVSKVTTAYVNAERDKLFWPNLITTLKTHFASEFVWITDIEPIANYDPLKPKPANVNDKNGENVISNTFDATVYGSSSLINIQKVEPAKSTGRSASATSSTNSNVANAIRIKGFWRENPASQNAVSTLIKNLRQSNSEYFSFTVMGADKKMQELKDEQIIKLLKSTSDSDGEYAWPFELVIPLARPIDIK